MRKFKSQFDKRPVRDGHFPCDDLLPGDGVDPRYEQKERKVVPNRKALQLCAQVLNAINLSLSACADPVLQQLQAVSVVPAPDSSQLLVSLLAPEGVEDAQARLVSAVGLLRTEVAASICRKRVPQLKFVLSRKGG